MGDLPQNFKFVRWMLAFSLKTLPTFVNSNEVCDELQTKKRARFKPSTPRSDFHLISESNKKDRRIKEMITS